MSMPALFKGRLSLPVIGAPLFIISVPDLVIAQCKAGVVGSFPALNARPPALLDEWIARIKQELAAHDKANPDRPSAPFAVNQIVHRSNNRLDQDLALCEKHKVPMIITSLGAREELNQAAHGWGGIVFHDVINQKFAHKAIEKGADGLILVSANGAPDCKAGADKLCQSKGYKEGKSLDTDAAEKCSPKVYLPGYKRQPGDCKTENYVTRALCQ